MGLGLVRTPTVQVLTLARLISTKAFELEGSSVMRRVSRFIQLEFFYYRIFRWLDQVLTLSQLVHADLTTGKS